MSIKTDLAKNKKNKSSLYFITSHPMSVLAFLMPHLRGLSDHFDLRVVANTCDTNMLKDKGLNVPVVSMPIVRSISPVADIYALIKLYKFLKINSPAAVHSVTPKAGLIGMLAAWLAGVPVRVHIFTGQVWVTRKGVMRLLLKLLDKAIALLATDILVDSPSQRDFLVQEGVVNGSKGVVLGGGSICGVNTIRFCPNQTTRLRIRAELGVADDALVCLYLGRISNDKGVLDLASAFSQIAREHPRVYLWVVGPDEENIFDSMMKILKNHESKIKRIGYTADPEQFMQAADLFCLPSYREGFGSSVIEAAACAVPALTSRIYGLTDAVAEGKTGWMYEAGNVQELVLKLHSILSVPSSLRDFGVSARVRAQELFSEEIVVDAMLSFYQSRLTSKK